MAIELGNATLFALVVLIINGGLQWIREVRKGTFGNSNGKDLKEIKDTMALCDTKLQTIDGKVGEVNVSIAEVKTSVDGQQKTCGSTVRRFDKAFSDQNKELISLAKESGRRK